MGIGGNGIDDASAGGIDDASAGVDSGGAGVDGGTRASENWPFLSEQYLKEWAPGVFAAQSSWLSSIDSLRAPDRKTHELIRMVCTVIARQPEGVERHARLAAEVGATWDEIAGSILLTEPAFGILLAVEAFSAARRGYKAGASRTGAFDPVSEDDDARWPKG